MKLFYKIAVPVSIVIFLLSSIISYYVISIQRESINNQYIDALKKDIVVVENSFDNLISNLTSMIKLASTDPRLIHLVETYNKNHQLTQTEEIELWEILKRSNDASNLLNNAFVTGNDGIIKYDAKKAFYINNYNLTFDQDNTNFKFYHDIRDNSDINYTVSDSRSAPANSKPVIVIAGRLLGQGFTGIIAYPINLSAFIDEIIYNKLNDEQVNILLIDKNGYIFGSKNETHLYNDKYNLKNLNTELFNSLVQNKEGSQKDTLLGEDIVLSFDYYEQLDAYILSYRTTDELNSTLINSFIYSIFSIIIIIFFTVVSILFLIKRLIRPITLLSHDVETLGEGDFNFEINPAILSRNDELYILGKNFEIMRDRLKNNFIALEEKNRKIKYFAQHDTLTKMKNRHFFESSLNHKLEYDTQLSVILIDIDDFKMINDTSGHIFGDKLLISVAKRLKVLVNSNTEVYRFGGDEFILIVEELINDSEYSTTIETVKRLQEMFQQPIIIENQSVDISFSIGISRYPLDGYENNELIRYADLALYQIKGNNKNNFAFFIKSMEDTLNTKAIILKELKQAIKENNFRMVYQPQIDVKSGDIVSYEALLRADTINANTGDIIMMAEETGSIIQIGRWVVNEVIKQMFHWRKEGYSLKPIAINYSAIQLTDTGFTSYLDDCLKRYKIDPSLIELEITENIFLDKFVAAIDFITSLQKKGISFSIDDFGTGYSSLSYLISLPIGKIKLDRSLLERFLDDKRLDAISSLIQLAHDLNYIVVAEGVETKDQYECLETIGCDQIQGYYISYPLNADDVFHKK